MSSDQVKVGVSNKEGQLGFVFARGGLREGAGRKRIGITRKVSLTLPEALWNTIETLSQEAGVSRSEAIRQLLEASVSDHRDGGR
ncbi:hypothetical protein PA598K_01965 [Paenibacillus sp. 598K]|uniref:ribbon-helix-helix protein, CopG family n=1 Tax=Paenibacillus sp. 598K TaxID=1117987 RepID=UPI000FF92EF6|nr:ribbon-helix-helix protein, CopG family [Paenibacillus sp. 598K]GBF73657.1 hypothetical protein PA598K_01965 [Paenibacillus sp. 598K]